MTCPRSAYGFECILPRGHDEPHDTGAIESDDALNAPAVVMVLAGPKQRRDDPRVLRLAVKKADECDLELISTEPYANGNPPAARTAWRPGYRLLMFAARPKEES